MEEIVKLIKKYRLFIIIIILLLVSSVSTVVLANANTVVVGSDSVNVRVGPGLSYSNMAQVKKGDKLTIISEKNKWYQVRLAGDKIGWVASWLLDNTDVSSTTNKVGIIKVPNTTIFKSASASSDVLGTANQSTKVAILYQESDWTQILYKGTAAWVKSEFIENTSETTDSTHSSSSNNKKSSNSNSNIKTVTVTQANTKLRIDPNSSGRIVKTVQVGKTFDYLGKDGDWYQVRDSDGSVGYVASWVVTISGSKSAVKTAASTISESTIVIDAGHGGDDVGAESENGKYEKTYTLAYAKAIKKELEKTGARVILTRSGDDSKTLGDRARLSSKENADAFISLHFDSSESNNDGSGVTTYYYADKDKNLATSIDNQLNTLPIDNKGVKQKDLYVLHYNSQPAVLLELGYINTKSDYKKIKSDSYKEKIASDVVAGLKQYFK
ncbi:N-acetylmuramoyl-L-alanine amidase [Lactobacillus terrae]|uniref:N-acetylmuramoyl-L-alanine amidase n=1 Tax=Lactobacillus terrae TaxID=2269374 RepID=UPI000C1B6B8D|nr:N-acetylmuramoyl-L-alanine amidase [Lactobacillus terrae]